MESASSHVGVCCMAQVGGGKTSPDRASQTHRTTAAAQPACIRVLFLRVQGFESDAAMREEEGRKGGDAVDESQSGNGV